MFKCIKDKCPYYNKYGEDEYCGAMRNMINKKCELISYRSLIEYIVAENIGEIPIDGDDGLNDELPEGLECDT